ncbi:MAG: hypothetical protein JXR96_07785, partial [Deltaproteobacteria bacterium]|nr:hypothetical protein [Deltaproteobacteria bacterium]
MNRLAIGLSLLASAVFALGCEDDGCPSGLSECGEACVDLLRDGDHCGECDHACEPGFVCDGSGHCALSCQAGLSDCDGTCVDLLRNPAYCGDCDTACDPGYLCDGSGHCALSCQ